MQKQHAETLYIRIRFMLENKRLNKQFKIIKKSSHLLQIQPQKYIYFCNYHQKMYQPSVK